MAVGEFLPIAPFKNMPTSEDSDRNQNCHSTKIVELICIVHRLSCHCEWELNDPVAFPAVNGIFNVLFFVVSF